MNASKFSSIKKSVRVNRLFTSSDQLCLCNDTESENYHGKYCIKKELLRDFKNIHLYKKYPMTQTLNLNRELKYIMFFCKVLHNRTYCNYLANLCVLTFYDLDINGPCHPFFRQQAQFNEVTPDETMYDGSEFDGGEKLKPFLFFKNSKRNPLSKIIDFSYDISNVSIHLIHW